MHGWRDLAQEGEGARVVEEQEGLEVVGPVAAERGVVGESDVFPLKIIDVCLKKNILPIIIKIIRQLF